MHNEGYITDAQMLADGRQICATMGIRPGDLNLGLIPFGHSYGLGNLVVPLLTQSSWAARNQVLGSVSIFINGLTASGNITLLDDGLTATAGAARLHDTMFVEVDIGKCRAGAHGLLRILDEQLWFAEAAGEQWLCSGQQPTIADLACFPYVMLSEEGGISRLPYPAIRRWGERVKQLPGFIPMSGIFPAAAA